MTTEKVQRFIAAERELSQLKHWLKSSYKNLNRGICSVI